MATRNRRYLKRYETLATRYALTLNLCEDIIRRHGVARNVREGENGKNSFHDYLFLCFTKGTKTLGSIYLTTAAFRGEDSLILVRSVYEAYVQIAFFLRNPGAINDLVSNKLRSISGELVADHRKHRFLDPSTKEEIGEMHSVGKMARNTWCDADSQIHGFFYPYLCSYSHMDVQSLPYFLEGDRFTTQNKDRIHQAALYSSFYAVLLLDAMGRLKVHSESYRRRVLRSLAMTRKVLIGILEDIHADGRSGDVPLRFLFRLQDVGAAWRSKNEPNQPPEPMA